MSASATDDVLKILDPLVAKAKAEGADDVEAMLVNHVSTAVSWRDGKVESLEESDSGDIGLRVFIGKRQASVASTDRRPAALQKLVERAVAMARVAPEDPFAGLATPEEIARDVPVLDLADTFDVTPQQLVDLAREAEDAARAVAGVTLVDSTDASASQTVVSMAFSNGFVGATRRTHYATSASVIAGADQDMVTDYDFAARTHRADLPSAAEIGRRAGERTVHKLGPRKMPTCQVPVVFDPREAAGLLRHFAGAISGASVARGTSFLKDELGKAVFPTPVTIVDDPYRPRGLRSRAFDGEGCAVQRRALVEQGVLTSWLLDLRSARQLGLATTGHASRSVGGVPYPSATNLYLENGALSVDDLIADIDQGFYVTQQMGMGINGVTGDYSQAASGFWIEKGKIAFPVHEVTIASNMRAMFASIVVANDLAFERGIDAPTLRVERMTVAGN
jgi:PmbA protein